MSRVCPITGKKVMFGHNVSHANNKTKRRFNTNMKRVRLQSETLSETHPMRITTRGIRTIDFHGGFDNYLLTTKNSKLTTELKRIKKRIIKQEASKQ